MRQPGEDCRAEEGSAPRHLPRGIHVQHLQRAGAKHPVLLLVAEQRRPPETSDTRTCRHGVANTRCSKNAATASLPVAVRLKLPAVRGDQFRECAFIALASGVDQRHNTSLGRPGRARQGLPVWLR